MQQNEKTTATAPQPRHTKPTNGGPPGTPETLTKADVATVSAGTAATGKAPTPEEVKRLRLEEEEKLRVELRALFKQYDEKDQALRDLHGKILDAKRARSKVVEKIAEISPKRKTFDRDGQIFTIMSREDKNEKSPSHGERFFYFRLPGIPDPFEI